MSTNRGQGQNKPGESKQFLSLVSVISCHNPGKLSGHAAAHMRRQKDLGFPRFTVVVDRAYNGERIENFHLPAARLGLDLVFDYKKDDLGAQSHFDDLVQVDGSWYVNWMPQGLIDVTSEYLEIEERINAAERVIFDAEHFVKKEKTTQAQMTAMATAERAARKLLDENTDALPTQQERLAMRDPYRMIPKGHRDTDGYQRFSYPPVEKMLVRPPASHEKKATITVPPTLPFDEKVASGQQSARKSRTERAKGTHVKSQPIKHWQRYAYKSPEWRSNYGLRSLVEASNSLLKTKDHGDIETPTKRSGRGYAATYLALAYAVVASNLKRIATFFANEAIRIERSKTPHRTRRRTDDLGRPLAASAKDDPPALTT